MVDKEKINVSVYKKCGDMLFAIDTNKIVMCCNFCQEIFKQMQGFIRHLQMEHADKINFMQQFKEVEVYAVEELINQTMVSCATDVESGEANMKKDEAEWLNERDLKWLDEGIEPKDDEHVEKESVAIYSNKEDGSSKTKENMLKEHALNQSEKGKDQFNVTNKENNDLEVTNKEDELNVTNISILKALEDCDVSFNFGDKLSSTRRTEDEQVSNLDNTLLQQIRNDWEDSDINDNTQNEKDVGADTTVIELALKNSFMEENPNKAERNTEQSPVKSIKNLLQGLEELDDVDISLVDLENETITIEDNTLQRKPDFNSENCDDQLFLKRENNHVLENKSFAAELSKTEFENNELLEEHNSETESNTLDNFEDRLKELENALNEDSLSSSSSSTRNIFKANNETSKDAGKKPNLEQKLGELDENSIVIDENNDSSNIEVLYSDLEKEPETVQEKESTISQCKVLNEDLAKALVDALDSEDLDLLNMQLEDENLEPLDESMIDLLEHELEENENEIDVKLHSKEKQSGEPLNEDILNVLEREVTDKKLWVPIEQTSGLERNETGKVTKPSAVEQENEEPLNKNILEVLERELTEKELYVSELEENTPKLEKKLTEKPTKFSSGEEDCEKHLNQGFRNGQECEIMENNLLSQKQLMSALDETEFKKDKISSAEKRGSKNPLNVKILNVAENAIIEQELLAPKHKSSEKIFRENETDDDELSKRKEQNEEPLNDDILNVLERELVDKDLPAQKQKMSDTSSNNVLKKENLNTYFKSEFISYKENKILKYQKTNINARNKKLLLLNKNELSSTTKEVFNETNFNISNQINSNIQNSPFKENQQMFSNTINSFRSPTNQENSNLNRQQIEIQEFTPSRSFINTERGNKTPIKTEEMFLKKSSKTEEKHKTFLQNVTPRRGEKTPKKQIFKTQDMQENLFLKKTPETVDQTNPHFGKKTELKQYSAIQNNKNKLLEKSPPKKENGKSPLNFTTTRSKEKLSTPPKIATHTSKNSFTTPSTPKLKNVTIKLQRFTPDKLAFINKNHTVNYAEQIAKHFSIPKNITLTVLGGRQQAKTEDNQCDIIETPIRTSTYSKQNFTESSLKIRPEKDKLYNLKSNCKDEKTLPSPNTPRFRQRMPSIDILKTAEDISKQEISSNITQKTPRQSNLDYKSYAVIRSTRKKEVLQRMRKIRKQIFKSIEGGNSLPKFTNKKFAVTKHKKQQNVVIQSVEVLPKLGEFEFTPLRFNNFKKPFANNFTTPTTCDTSKNVVKGQSPKNNLREEDTKTSLKRRASSPIFEGNDSAKRQHISPTHKQDEEKISSAQDSSESCVNFLQPDLKSNHLNVETFLNSDMPKVPGTTVELNLAELKNEGKDTEDKEIKDEEALIMNDLLDQVENENFAEQTDQTENATNNTETSSSSITTVEDFNDAKDIELLDKFGLKIIKLPNLEDFIFLEERDKIHEKARKFAHTYKNWQRIWSTKNCESPTYKEELDNSFKGLLSETYLMCNVKVNLVEIKRLVNLISFWFTQYMSKKVNGNRNISEQTKRFLSYFLYIPKTIKRFFYCEFCDEYFNTEHKYFTHRIIHTGAKYPYTCRKCSLGYRILKQLMQHESTCSAENRRLQQVKPILKCQECSEQFETMELLYKHNKTHLKKRYRCAKCNIIFTSAFDVEKHLNLCRSRNKSVPKPDTPRQAKLIRNHPI